METKNEKKRTNDTKKKNKKKGWVKGTKWKRRNEGRNRTAKTKVLGQGRLRQSNGKQSKEQKKKVGKESQTYTHHNDGEINKTRPKGGVGGLD